MKKESVLNRRVKEKAILLAYSFMQKYYKGALLESYKDLQPPKVLLCLQRAPKAGTFCDKEFCNKTGCYWTSNPKSSAIIAIYKYNTDKLNTLIHEMVHYIQDLCDINPNSRRSEKSAVKVAAKATSHLLRFIRRMK